MDSNFIWSGSQPITAFTDSFLEWAWSHRDDLNKNELSGLHATVIIFANSTLEAIVLRTLQSALHFTDSELNNYYANRTTKRNSIEFSLQTEFLMLQRLKNNLEDSLDSAAFGKLNPLNKQILGMSLKDIVGPKLWEDWRALAELRNILAHGRAISFEGNHETGDFQLAGSKHTELKKVVNRLKEKNLVHKQDHFGSLLCASARYFFESSKLICDKYVKNLPQALRAEVEPKLPRLPDLAMS